MMRRRTMMMGRRRRRRSRGATIVRRSEQRSVERHPQFRCAAAATGSAVFRKCPPPQRPEVVEIVDAEKSSSVLDFRFDLLLGEFLNESVKERQRQLRWVDHRVDAKPVRPSTSRLKTVLLNGGGNRTYRRGRQRYRRLAVSQGYVQPILRRTALCLKAGLDTT